MIRKEIIEQPLLISFHLSLFNNESHFQILTGAERETHSYLKNFLRYYLIMLIYICQLRKAILTEQALKR